MIADTAPFVNTFFIFSFIFLFLLRRHPALLTQHTKPPAVLHLRLGAYLWVKLSNGLYLTLSSDSIGYLALGFRLKLMSPCFLKQW